MLAAPCDEETGCSKDLSVALANRSAVLFSLKAYHLALDDIRLALESGYPKVVNRATPRKKSITRAIFWRLVSSVMSS